VGEHVLSPEHGKTPQTSEGENTIVQKKALLKEETERAKGATKRQSSGRGRRKKAIFSRFQPLALRFEQPLR